MINKKMEILKNKYQIVFQAFLKERRLDRKLEYLKKLTELNSELDILFDDLKRKKELW